jgi:hypothetical protein
MKSSSAAIRSSIAAVVLLMPLTAAAESHIESAAATASLTAAAHLNFKIVIPTILYLQVASQGELIAGEQTAAVMSTGRDVTLNATVLTAARRSIAQNVPCGRGDAHLRTLVCTASMP